MIWPVIDSKAKEPFYVHRPCFFLIQCHVNIVLLMIPGFHFHKKME